MKEEEKYIYVVVAYIFFQEKPDGLMMRFFLFFRLAATFFLCQFPASLTTRHGSFRPPSYEK